MAKMAGVETMKNILIIRYNLCTVLPIGLWKISSTVNFLTIPCQMKKSIMIKIETI